VRPTRIEFTPDDELIDPATGEDPTPIDPRPVAQPGSADGEEAPHDSAIVLTNQATADAER